MRNFYFCKKRGKKQTNSKSSFSLEISLVLLTILSGYNCLQAREKKTVVNFRGYNPSKICKKTSADIYPAAKRLTKESESAQSALLLNKDETKKPNFAATETQDDERVKKKEAEKENVDDDTGGANSSPVREKFHWKPALIQSSVFLGIQHGYRVAVQKGTRQHLAGPFFRDWAQSVKNLRGWRDGNRFFINYIGHPLQGGLTGRIFVNNSDQAKKHEFSKSKKYWESRFKAMAWSAVWSTQFELGPISEANIGNVGLVPRGKHGSMAYVDLVVTPVLGTGMLVGEDAIDKYILKNWIERKGSSKTKVRILRSFLTPTTSIGNLLRGKAPWERDNR